MASDCVVLRAATPFQRSGTPAMHCLIAWGQWVVQIPQYAPAICCQTAGGQWAVELLLCTALLPGGSGKCNSCNELPHRPGAVGSGTLAMRRPINWGDGESCMGGGRCLKSGTPAMHCHTARGSGQWNAGHALPQYLGAVGIGTPAMHCRTALGAVGSEPPTTHHLAAWG